MANREIEEAKKELSKRYATLLDDTIAAMEDQINETIVKKLETHADQVQGLTQIDHKLERHVEYVKESFEKLTKTQDDHLELISEVHNKIRDHSDQVDPKIQ